MLRVFCYLLMSGMLLFSNLSIVSASTGDDHLGYDLNLDFRSNGIQPILNESTQYTLNHYCSSQADWCGRDTSKTLYQSLDDWKTQLQNDGYYYIIMANYSRDDEIFGGLTPNNGAWDGLGNYTIYVIDTTETDVSDLYMYVNYDNSTNSYEYNLDIDNDSNISYWSNTLADSQEKFGWDMSYQEFTEALPTQASSHASSLTLITLQDLVLTNSFVWYTNIPYTYRMGNDTIHVYNDFVDTMIYPEGYITIEDGLGWRFNQYYFLRNYATGECVNPDVYCPISDPDNPDNPNNPENPNYNDTILDTDTSSSQNQIGGFFDGFDNDNHGLADIVTAPLYFINHLLDTTCTPLTFPLPFTDVKGSLPCMSDIYTNYFGDIYLLYQEITTGIIAYWVLANMFRIMKNFKDPENSEIEVMDL